MRTTIAIDEDVLTAAKAIAHRRNQTVGKVVASNERNGVLLPVRKLGVFVTPEIVNALRDEASWLFLSTGWR